MSGQRSAAEDALIGAIDPLRVEDDLRTLVAIPSVTGDEVEVTDEAARLLGDLGSQVERFDVDPAEIAADPDFPGSEVPRTVLPLVFGRVGRPGGRRIILSGHLDVVPVGDPATWTVHPWGGSVRDGVLYGRGACDMKGGVAAILGATRALVTTGIADHLSGELLIALVPSEEDGGAGTLAAIRTGATGTPRSSASRR